VIRAYAEKYQSTLDLALELPTGTGKTLLGLAIGEWVRRKTEGPVTYATPTKQLARQVAANGAAGRCHSTLFMLAQVRPDGPRARRARLDERWYMWVT
jgi:hypothetical protein